MSSAPSPTLHAPRKSVELEDPGAHELASSENSDDVFSDARQSHSGPNSPIPTTRVEKVDDIPSHGEVPGTAAYNMRTQDAVPDELEIVPDGPGSGPVSRRGSENRPSSAEGSPIPKTVVEKVDPSSPSHGEIPGTTAHEIRKADAVPDLVLHGSDVETPSRSLQSHAIQDSAPIPATVVTKVDSQPAHGDVPGTDAYNKRTEDAKPDVVLQLGDVPGLPTSSLNRSPNPSSIIKRTSQGEASPIAADGGFGPMEYDEDLENERSDQAAPAHDDIGEDFDDFEEGGDDDFGDFDEGFQQPTESNVDETDLDPAVSAQQSFSLPISPLPLFDFSQNNSLDDFVLATEPYLNSIFPNPPKPSNPTQAPPSNNNSIFLTDRSRELWSQLVAPPPLQPPNWLRSRIRRLFLVSLGVPVDLDEILPASKQKKLVLSSTQFRGASRSPARGHRDGSVARLKQNNESSASVDSSTSKPARRRKGPAPPPELDLTATKLLCSTTDAALSNFTDEELNAHVSQLEGLTSRASEVLEYWLRRKDGALGDKEAFEGVVENLVKHARRVRK